MPRSDRSPLLAHEGALVSFLVERADSSLLPFLLCSECHPTGRLGFLLWLFLPSPYPPPTWSSPGTLGGLKKV